MKVSLLISTYNWPKALDLVLKSLARQTLMPQEVIIADDGSTPATKEIIEKHTGNWHVRVKHIWQEDQGFRRTLILNKAVAKAKGDYIIQLDGDCIMHPKFIEDHVTAAEKGVFLFGSRVNIQKEFLPILFLKRKTNFGFFDKGIKKRTRNLHVPILGGFYRKTDVLSKKVRGCNLSFWKSDFIKVNGYNEAMTGWGKEDSEMILRLLNIQIQGKRLRYQGIIYHIWHKESSKEKTGLNQEVQKKTMLNQLQRCENGIEKYL